MPTWQALYYEYGSDQNYILNFQKPKGAHKKSILLRDIAPTLLRALLLLSFLISLSLAPHSILPTHKMEKRPLERKH